jgi:hypothetical protein
LFCNREISSDRRVRPSALITIDVELPKSVRVDLSKRNGFTMSRTVLVVDNDASVLEAIAGMLEQNSVLHSRSRLSSAVKGLARR